MANRAIEIKGKVLIRGKIQRHKELLNRALDESWEENGQFVFGKDKKPLTPFIQDQEKIIGTLCMTLNQAQ